MVKDSDQGGASPSPRKAWMKTACFPAACCSLLQLWVSVRNGIENFSRCTFAFLGWALSPWTSGMCNYLMNNCQWTRAASPSCLFVRKAESANKTKQHKQPKQTNPVSFVTCKPRIYWAKCSKTCSSEKLVNHVTKIISSEWAFSPYSPTHTEWTKI